MVENRYEMKSITPYNSYRLTQLNNVINLYSGIEENQKSITNIYFSTISKGIFDFDSAQTATIYDIAMQCPLSGGKAVAIAQTMYQIVNDTLTFASDTSCSGASPRLFKSFKVEINSLVYPNPSINNATLKYSLPDCENLWFIIYDVLGNEKQRMELYSKNTTKKFSCQHFSQGIYFYKIINEKNVISYGKFSIIR